MQFVVDVGNTNIVGGVFDGDTLLSTLRIRTVPGKTEDEYGVIFKALLAERSVDFDAVDTVLISSVVPQLTGSMQKLCMHLFKKQPLVMGPALYKKLPVEVIAPDEIGADLVANSFAAWKLCETACLIVDFGTALTFTAVDSHGRIVGVAIAPGLATAVSSLSSATAQLPVVPLEAPQSALGQNTIQAIQSGIVLGYAGLVENMVARFKKEMGDITIIATGGLHRVIAPVVNIFNRVEPDLTLRGLHLICNEFNNQGWYATTGTQPDTMSAII